MKKRLPRRPALKILWVAQRDGLSLATATNLEDARCLEQQFPHATVTALNDPDDIRAAFEAVDHFRHANV